jgi:hypothetical protein
MVGNANVRQAIGSVRMMSVQGANMAGVEGCAFWVAPHIPRIPRPVRNQAHIHTHPVAHLACADAHASYLFLCSYILLASSSR